MRFIFAVISNITYTLFCLGMEYILLFVYGSIITSTPNLQSANIVAMMLAFSTFVYALCVVLMLLFGIEKFSSENDKLMEVKLGGEGVSYGTPEDDTDSVSVSGNGKRLQHISVHTTYVLNILLCHITIIASLSTVLFVTLYECIYDARSVQCVLVWGNHSASQGVAIAVSLIMLSILVPAINLYKCNSSGTRILDCYGGTYLVFYVFFTHCVLRSRITKYKMQCMSSLYVVRNMRWFQVAMGVHLFYHFVVVGVLDMYAPADTVVVYTEALATRFQKWSLVMQTLSMICNAAVLVFFIAYGYDISTAFNYFQTVALAIYMASSSYRIIYVKETLTVRPHYS